MSSIIGFDGTTGVVEDISGAAGGGGLGSPGGGGGGSKDVFGIVGGGGIGAPGGGGGGGGATVVLSFDCDEDGGGIVGLPLRYASISASSKPSTVIFCRTAPNGSSFLIIS